VKQNRKIVVVTSIAVGVVSFGYFVYDRIYLNNAVPLWDTTAMIYSGVFLVFLFLDTIGKTAASLRSDSDKSRGRSRPLPTTGGGPAVVNARTRATREQVNLLRLRADQNDVLRPMLDIAIPEVMALDDDIPAKDANGHVICPEAVEWFNAGYVFHIQYRQDVVGACVLVQARGQAWRLALCYVESGARRRRVGTEALQRVVEFARLLEFNLPITTNVSVHNVRAIRFLAAAGWHEASQAMSTSTGHITFQA